ncbi:hypothetical protein [Streptomyces sp. NBC_00557]|uniref:hypothetical protein n=1 Tax=Streptomyces sp. NBC_00557 TaxID=2975776 RepID=UPI002E80B68B|nr:hypothetical protein [Streptomyces sp. NBC_00557]WUC38631.1 hypothetical protein OG956_32550 [Streptomyces sp. NBC_00557]
MVTHSPANASTLRFRAAVREAARTPAYASTASWQAETVAPSVSREAGSVVRP